MTIALPLIDTEVPKSSSASPSIAVSLVLWVQAEPDAVKT